MNFLKNRRDEKQLQDSPAVDRRESVAAQQLEALPKTRWERSWPTIACGAGLFSDGYLNGYARKIVWLYSVLT